MNQVVKKCFAVNLLSHNLLLWGTLVLQKSIPSQRNG